MDYPKFITFLILALLSTPVFSTAVDLSNQSNFAKSSSGLMWATKASGAPTGQLITSNRASVPFQYNVPNGQSLVPVNGTREANISLSRVGKAAANFAKKVGPIAVGIAVADAICDLADICNVDGIFQKEVDPNTAEIIGQHIGWCVSNGGSVPCFPNDDLNQSIENANACLTQQNSNCFVDDIRPVFQDGNLVRMEYRFGFISNGTFSNYMPATPMTPYVPLPSTTTEVEDSDWDNAETALNDEQFIQPLFDAGEPLPVDQPDPFPPVNTITGSTTKTIKDGDGNIIGTEVTEKTLTVTDTSDANSPNLVDVQETTKVSTYDQNNNLTGESTSVSEPPPPPTESQNEDIEFDDVNDTNLDTHDVDLEFTPQSWGTGTCPPDIDIATTLGGTQTLSMQPVCDFATSVNPIVLVMSSLIAMYLVSGVRLD